MLRPQLNSVDCRSPSKIVHASDDKQHIQSACNILFNVSLKTLLATAALTNWSKFLPDEFHLKAKGWVGFNIFSLSSTLECICHVFASEISPVRMWGGKIRVEGGEQAARIDSTIFHQHLLPPPTPSATTNTLHHHLRPH